MTSAVPGLIKIGKTGSNNYDTRMNFLEQNGYRNVTSLKRTFAIEVDDYDEKEVILHTIFEKTVSLIQSYLLSMLTLQHSFSLHLTEPLYILGSNQKLIFLRALRKIGRGT